jgi:hypothetical protein
MNAYVYAYIIILFIAVTPGILLHFPPGANGYIVAISHALFFTLIWEYTHKYVYSQTYSEGFQIQDLEATNFGPHPTEEQQKKMLQLDQLKGTCMSNDMCPSGSICKSGRCI